MTDLGINLNCASKKEHVLEIERFIRTVKERFRSAQSTMLSKRISKLIILHLVVSDFFLLDSFTPSTPGALLLDTTGHGQLILRNTVDYKRFCLLQPGEYFQVRQEDEPRNMIYIDRTNGAIALGPQYNLQ